MLESVGLGALLRDYRAIVFKKMVHSGLQDGKRMVTHTDFVTSRILELTICLQLLYRRGFMRILKEIDIKVCFTPVNTVGSLMSYPKNILFSIEVWCGYKVGAALPKPHLPITIVCSCSTNGQEKPAGIKTRILGYCVK